MATAFIRTIVLYFLIMVGLRLLGKRQIGELEPIELVLTLLISDLAAVPMQDFGIPLLNGVVPIVTLLALSMLLSYGCMRSIRLRRIPFSPLRPWKRCCMSVCLRCRCPVPSARAKGRFCCCFARLFRAVRCNMQCCSAAASASICLSHAAAARLPCGSCFSPTNKRSRKKTRAFVILCNFFVSMQ